MHTALEISQEYLNLLSPEVGKGRLRKDTERPYKKLSPSSRLATTDDLEGHARSSSRAARMTGATIATSATTTTTNYKGTSRPRARPAGLLCPLLCATA